jgi:hypothetical protein
VAQVVEQLPSKHKAPKPQHLKKKKKKKVTVDWEVNAANYVNLEANSPPVKAQMSIAIENTLTVAS